MLNIQYLLLYGSAAYCERQGDKRIFTYMSQATGLMADLDLGTEHLRWMGDVRFFYGYFRGGTAFYALRPDLQVKKAQQQHLL